MNGAARSLLTRFVVAGAGATLVGIAARRRGARSLLLPTAAALALWRALRRSRRPPDRAETYVTTDLALAARNERYAG